MTRVLPQVLCAILIAALGAAGSPSLANPLQVGWQQVDGIDLFYREGGRSDAPTLVFLHGNPASSLQYEEVMKGLAKTNAHHVLAVDYPSFGFSAAPDHGSYRYTFDNVADTVRKFLRARGVTRYGLFMQDYGVPIGFRLIAAAPDSITAIVVQNGVIHLDGFPAAQDENGELRRHWKKRNPDLEKRRREYTMGLTFPQPANWTAGDDPSPDFILVNLTSAQRPGVIAARADMWFDYGTNLAHYAEWQAMLRRTNVPVLVLWGGRDDYFTTPGAMAYLRDAPRAEVHILDADHFATLDVPEEIVRLTADFLARHGEKRQPDGGH